MTATRQRRTIVQPSNGFVIRHWLPGLIRTVFTGRHAPAHVARITGSSSRAADYYIAGERDMAATKLLKLMAASSDFEQQVLAQVRAEREKTIAINQSACRQGNRVDADERRVDRGMVARRQHLPAVAPTGQAAGTAAAAVVDGAGAARAGRAAAGVERRGGERRA